MRASALFWLSVGCQPRGTGDDRGADPQATNSTVGDSDSALLDTGECITSTWYRDADGDGFGDAGAPTDACVAPIDHVADSTDCDDAHMNAFTGAPERVTDGVDNDCDGNYAVTRVADVPTWSVAGTEPDSNWFGATLAMPGDLNADGHDDLVVGTGEGSGDGVGREGAALVFYGPLQSQFLPATVSDADSVLYGGALELVEHACGPGDVDGDGLGDLIVSGPFFGDNQGTGVAYLMFGPFEGHIDLPSAARTFRGEHVGAYLGLCAGPGDLTGDGLADVVLSASDLSSTAPKDGSVYILHGPAAHASVAEAETIFRGTGFGEFIGSSLADVGDINGDGQRDLGIGNAAPESTDGLATYLVTEFPDGLLHPRDVGATVQYDRSGSGKASVMLSSGVGDVTGDGYDDVAFGVDRSSQSNVMAILAGPFDNTERIDLTTEYEIALVSNDGGLYTQLSFATSVVDWDGDGTGDLAVSNPYFTPIDVRDSDACSREAIGCQYGAVFLKAGPIASGAYDIEGEADRIEGVIGLGQLGAALAGGSDLNADGFPDLAVGAPQATVGTAEIGGIAYVLFGGGAP